MAGVEQSYESLGHLETLTTAAAERDEERPSGATVLAGDHLGEFRLERRLGAGGMGEVFAATHVDTGQAVALKVLGQTGSTHLYRFKREFRALADVRHHNLAALHELYILAGRSPFFTMELVDGRPFIAYVREQTPPGRAPELGRLHAALRGLVRGIHHLHGTRCIHRDLKPSNVLVTAEGRSVILDFGLVAEATESDAGVTGHGQILGTPAYMAPEQIVGCSGSAVDYYAIGVMLFECLTGQLPYTGPAMSILVEKQERDAPDPRTIATGVPDDLGTLCMQLLARDPEQRPTGRELLALWDRRSDSSLSPSIVDTRQRRSIPFVGREPELRALHAAFEEVERDGASITVHLHGPSGHGKSALVHRFLGEVRRHGRVLVLHGRCLMRESVAYKGVDAVVDALSVHLRRMAATRLAELRPRHVGPLLRLFPVLVGVWDESEDPVVDAERAFEPAELRSLGLSALRDVFAVLAAQQPVVVCVDDLQWANPDGVNLLTWIMQPPESPPLLLVAAFRDEGEHNLVLGALTNPASLAQRDVRELSLGPLSDEAATELIHALIEASGRIDLDVAAVVHRAGGSPFYIGQIVAGDRSVPDSDASLDHVVVGRIAELEPLERRLLECVAVAGGPLAVEIVRELVSDEAVDASIDRLRTRGLFRRSRSKSDESDVRLDTTHDRIREVAVGGLEIVERRRIHLEIAAALEERGADPETLAHHFVEAGEPTRAAAHVEQAAEQAVQALAFARAVQLHRRALELLPSEGSAEHRDRLRRGLAWQLVNLGHGAEAAELLLELADAAPPEEAERFRQEAARQMIHSGRIDEGIELLAEVFEAKGEFFPRTRRRTLLMFFVERFRLWVRGWTYELREHSAIPSERLERLDALLAVTSSAQEVLLSIALHARAMRLSLDAGEPRSLGLSMSHEISIQAGMGRFERARHLSAECKEIAGLADDPEVGLAVDMASAHTDWLSYRFVEARQKLATLLPRLEEVPGSDWIRVGVVVRYMDACMTTGHFGRFRQELPRRLTRAQERGNLLEAAWLEGYAAATSAYCGDLVGARRYIESARARWSPSRYNFASMVMDFTDAYVRMMEDDLEGADEQINLLQRRLQGAGMHRFRMCADALERVRVRHLMHGVLRGEAGRSAARRISKLAKRWRKSSDPTMRGEALINEAALHSIGRDLTTARVVWRRAEEHFLEYGMRAHLAAVRARLEEVTTGQESRRFSDLVEEYLSTEGIHDRIRFVDVFAPVAATA